jgi:lipopolysaccharide export system protein LptA
VLAGCFGGRRGRPAETPAATPDSVAVVAPPITRDDSLRTDSARTDSIARARVADSIALADSARVGQPLRDTAGVAQDSAKKVTVPAKKPARDCVLDFNENPPDSRILSNLLNDGSRTTYIGGGFFARCQGEPQTIRADSAEQYENAGVLILVGNVIFEEPGKMRVTAPSATYFQQEEKIVGYGGVVATDLPTGSTFTGPTIEYFRAASFRPEARLFAPQRPTMRLIEKDSTGAERPPVSITANQLEQRGDTTLAGWGDVVITRQDIEGRSDSASFNKFTETARLIRNASIVSSDTARSFRLVGDSIDMFSKDRVLERVLAMHRAQATSNDVSMRAERVEMHLDSARVDRAWAYGEGRSYAETSSQQLEADSIEILMPGQLVRTLNASGKALAFGTPDSTRIRNAERDVLAGDTIIASFDTLTTPPDTSPKSVIREVLAIASASARYQIPSTRGANCPPGINYSRGKRILVSFDSSSVRKVTVDSAASGVYLEPAPDSLGDSTSVRCAPPADSTASDSVRAVPPDSTRPPVTVPPDSVRPPTAVPPARPQLSGATLIVRPLNSNAARVPRRVYAVLPLTRQHDRTNARRAR